MERWSDPHRLAEAMDHLVQDDRAHGDIYTSQAIFEAEMRHIFHSWWVYVAHESEVQAPGDYVRRTIGRMPVIVSRDEDGQVHLLLNRCRHRGSTVCQYDKGNSSSFRCQYHGWTYRNDGRLTGVPFPSRYGESFRKEDFALTPVPRVGTHRGFIFASLSPDGLPFEDYIAPARAGIDAFVSASPVGEVELSAGSHKSAFGGNWKFVGQDGYHPAFTHRTIQEIRLRHDPDGPKDHAGYNDRSPDRTLDLGHGHARLDKYPTRVPKAAQKVEKYQQTEDGRRYLADMAAVHGEDDVARVLGEADPHMTVWPNLMLTGTQVRVTNPIAADASETIVYPAMLRGVPASVNAARLRAHEEFHGPAGFGTPDDYEIFERNQLGLQADLDPWVHLGRGIEEEVLDDGGLRVGSISDETPQRGQLREWKRVMTIGLNGQES